MTGLLYLISGLFTGHFRKNLLPARADLSWRAFSTAIASHLRFQRPSEAEAWSYNVLQRLTYLFVIFVLFPLVIWTGLAMSPAFVSAFPATVNVLGGQQSARTLHFFVSLALVLFLLVHVVMVCRCRIQEPHARDDHRPRRVPEGAHMSNLSRRKLITTGLAATAGVAGLGVAARLAQKYGLVPPDHGGIYGLGETLTYASQRLLTRHSLAREFSRARFRSLRSPTKSRLSSDAFKRLQAGGFADWRLTVDGMVARPASFSLDQLKSYPSRSQITMLQCEEGWSYIAEWIGVPLSHVLDAAWDSTRRPDTSSTSRSIPTGGKASIWPTHCIRRLFSPMG